MIIYFTLYSILGFFLESLYISMFKKKWVSSGILKGPYIPLYGIGACFLLICSSFMKTVFHCFFIGGFFITLLELFSSYFIEFIFKTKLWDYTKHHFSFQGRICILYSCIWGILSYILLYYVHPFISSHFPINTLTLLACCIILFLMFKDFLDIITQAQKKKVYQ